MKLERVVESLLLSSRWLLVPVYLVLSLILIVFGIKAAQEMVHLFQHVFELSEVQLTLAVLSLIDMTLVAGLLVMVALSGYETFVSPFDTVGDMERPGWLGKLDPGTVKIKLAASIVAISAIHLLRSYLNADSLSSERLLVLTAIHLAFVVSALLLAWTDKISGASHG
jgi:uncharacterized protein (TIGR00645 family)